MATLKQLQKAAVELNKVLGLVEPAIDTKCKDVEELEGLIREAITMIVKEDQFEKGELVEKADVFKEPTQKVIDELSVKADAKETPKKEKAPKAEKVEKPKKVVEASISLEDQIADISAKKKDLIAIINNNLEAFPNAEELLEITNVMSLRKAMKEAFAASPALDDKLKGKKEKKNKKAPKEEVKEEKASKKEKKEKKADKPKKKKGAKTAERVAFLTPLIEKGKFTKKELVEKAHKEFADVSESTLSTFLTDAKNPKYNAFVKLVIENGKKQMEFTDATERPEKPKKEKKEEKPAKVEKKAKKEKKEKKSKKK